MRDAIGIPVHRIQAPVLRAPAFPEPAPFPLRDFALHRFLAFSVGFLLPLLTFKTDYYGTPKDLASRIAAVDVLCLLMFGLVFLRGFPARLPRAAMLYFVALIVSLFPALVVSPGAESVAWTTFTAVLMAFLFYVLGLNIGESREMLTSLLAGVCAITLLESVIVFHDYFFSSQWFPDPMEGRARGTFKANGQLGAYGFCAAGMLIALGRIPRSEKLRALCLVTGLLAATFVFTASRRTGMICVALWAVAFAVMGVRFANRGFYKLFVLLLVLGVALGAIGWGTLSHSFAGQRLTEGLSKLGTSDSFIQAQHKNILRSAGSWFPLGFGPGRGSRIDPLDPEHHEVHNGLLAVLVELGVAGFLGFVGMVVGPLFSRPAGRGTEDRALRRMLVVSFLLICFVFMLHNTLYRDRTFLLFLGMATAIARKEALRPATAAEGVA